MFCAAIVLPVSVCLSSGQGYAAQSHRQPRAANGGASNSSSRGEGALRVVTGAEGSVVFINNIRHGTTGSSGELDLLHVKAGTFPVKIRTVGFADYHGVITIQAGANRPLKVRQFPTRDEAIIHYQKAELLRDGRKDDEAVKEFEEAIRLRPGFAEAHISLARVLITAEQFDEAETNLRAAMRTLGSAAEAYTVLANLRRTQGLYDESITDYKRAIVLAHGISPEAHIGLAIALEEKNDMVSAITEYRKGIAQDMDTEPILYYLLGRALEKQGDAGQAMQAYQGYLRLDPQGQYSSAVASIINRLKQDAQQ